MRVSSKPSCKVQSWLERLGRGTEPLPSQSARVATRLLLARLRRSKGTICTERFAGAQRGVQPKFYTARKKKKEEHSYAVGHAFPGQVHLISGGEKRVI